MHHGTMELGGNLPDALGQYLIHGGDVVNEDEATSDDDQNEGGNLKVGS